MRIRAALRALVRWGGDWSLDSGETSKRYRVNGDNGLDLVLCENIACLEKWMTRYGIEGDWHLMDALENKSCDAHTIIQGYTDVRGYG
ncbi:hypothetical protein E4U44_000700 [Claviceps purpurea]|nr:hypothetical protein E4U37_000518 [Claviceps purpurea]KAG6300124.1 hypothetical protein E4U44_000700 [Claviceps purpurea]